MDSAIYRKLKETAVRTAESIGLPAFYSECTRELAISASYFLKGKVLHDCRSHIDESKLHPAHGIPHCEKVAIEAGAVLLLESEANGHHGAGTEEMMRSVQIAGLLHDITRRGKDHSITGSIEAGRILEKFDITERHKGYITAAIRNHEAFRDVLVSHDESAKLISDSLYDADKFRWGPDNFTTTLWLMVESSGTSSESLFLTFREKMKGITRIKDTFRSETGRRYGPEFIDFGIEIGNRIYQEMEKIIGD